MNAYHQGQLDYFCAVYTVINALRLTHGIGLTDSREIFATALKEISAKPELWQALLDNNTDHHWVIRYLLGRFCHKGAWPLRVARLPLNLPQAPLKMKNDDELRDWLGFAEPENLDLNQLGGQDLYNPLVEFGRGPEHPVRLDGTRIWNIKNLWQLFQYWLPSKGIFSGLGIVHKQKRGLLLRFHRYLPHQSTPLISHWSTGKNFNKDTLQLYDCTANKDAIHALPLGESVLYPEFLSPDKLLGLEPASVYFLERLP